MFPSAGVIQPTSTLHTLKWLGTGGNLSAVLPTPLPCRHCFDKCTVRDMVVVVWMRGTLNPLMPAHKAYISHAVCCCLHAKGVMSDAAAWS